jgi:hypothetical protein
MTKSQVLEAIRQMSSVERSEVVEFTLHLMREEMERNTESKQTNQLSLVAAAAFMRSYYEEGSKLSEFSDLSQEDFYEYEEYA